MKPAGIRSMHRRQAKLVPFFPGDQIANQEFEAYDAFAIASQLASELQTIPVSATAESRTIRGDRRSSDSFLRRCVTTTGSRKPAIPALCAASPNNRAAS
jgi:hypothetical protein